MLVNKYIYSTCVPWVYIDSYSARVGKENLWNHRNLSLIDGFILLARCDIMVCDCASVFEAPVYPGRNRGSGLLRIFQDSIFTVVA